MSERDDWIVSLQYTDDVDRKPKYFTIVDLVGDSILGGVRIGRGKDDSLINTICSSVVSKVQCRLSINVDGEIYIEDLSSRHGSTIHPPGNLPPIPMKDIEHAVRIFEGDIITLGQVVNSGGRSDQPVTLQVRYKYPANHRSSYRLGTEVYQPEAYKNFVGVEDYAALDALEWDHTFRGPAGDAERAGMRSQKKIQIRPTQASRRRAARRAAAVAFAAFAAAAAAAAPAPVAVAPADQQDGSDDGGGLDG